MDAVLQELGQGIEPADRALWGTTALVPVMAKARTACHNGFRAHLAGGEIILDVLDCFSLSHLQILDNHMLCCAGNSVYIDMFPAVHQNLSLQEKRKNRLYCSLLSNRFYDGKNRAYCHNHHCHKANNRNIDR